MTKSTNNLLYFDKAYTFFIVPFYFGEGEWNDIHGRISKWQPLQDELYRETDVLYPYIVDLFKQNNPNNRSQIKIFELQSKDEGINSQMFTQRILGKAQWAILAKNSSERAAPQVVQFKLMNDKSFAPHLYISLAAQIGILTFSIELMGDKTIAQQISLNYALHKRNEVNNYQCVCLNPEKQETIQGSVNYDTIVGQIPDLWKENQRSTMRNPDYICWNLNDFVDCIMGTMGYQREGQKRIKYFSKYRMHLFSFCSMQDIENKYTENEIIPELLRLSRCVDSKYLLPFNQLTEQGCVLQTYENIFFSSSIEGTAMIALGRENNRGFIDDLHQKFNRQYLLIYLLVIIQRYTLQNIERKLTEFESTEKQTDDGLWELINMICRIKTNCYYTDVSIYTHHSQFYHLCCDNLHISETFEEIGGKIEMLKLITDQNIHKRLMIQEEQHQAEMAAIAEEDKKAESRQRMLNWIIGILTIAQVMEASYELIRALNDEYALIWSLAIGISSAIILILLMRKDIVQFFFRKHNKHA